MCVQKKYFNLNEKSVIISVTTYSQAELEMTSNVIFVKDERIRILYLYINEYNIRYYLVF